MRSLFLFCLLLLGLDGVAQRATTPFRVDSIPKNGLAFKTDWRWRAGDNRAWASPTFDDSRWETVKPTRRIGRLPQVAEAGISWFRLAFRLDSAQARESLAFDVFLNGAADLYLDGTLIQQLGRVSATAADEQRYKRVRGDLLMLPKLTPGLHTLAVRFSTHPTPWYIPAYIETKETLEVTLCEPASYMRHRVTKTHSDTLIEYLLIGSFLMLGSIHFLYYVYRRQTINLVFGLTALLYCLDGVANNAVPYMHSLHLASWIDYIGSLCSYSFPLMLSATYYLYLQRKHGRIFWSVTIVSILCLLVMYRADYQKSGFLSELPRIGLGIGALILIIDGLRITTVAMRQARTREKAIIILISFSALVAVLVLGAIAVLVVFWKTPTLADEALDVLRTVAGFGIPVTLAFLLAKEHDQTNSDLQKRLAEVEKLSGEKEAILTQQKETLERQVAKRTQKLNQSLQELRETQTQLVQREKMASLGELTAGIAHEIQNPLNFVNNFSEVSAELLDELRQEQARPADERDPELEAELLNDIHQNVSKIGHHGQRAASIVRGMLQHSRASTGEKNRTDLNALGDEYLRLSYHGLRAKDKTFNATLHTSLDPILEPVTVVAQDVGRVLLNLFNNAFYAVWDKARTDPDGQYHPTVWLYTRQLDGHIEIRVQDNGNGIPTELQRKIFQPFFTTKPTGQGTGLGLSLSYDIITKGHGGTLSVDTQPGEYTTFIITIPVDEPPTLGN
ncbi:ATP-binding protein [Fibrella sp. WM1]|uniref:ATP-binding protein n=1 Tax=Fibrella musci TaxID=3242485 RepID=UPI003522030F